MIIIFILLSFILDGLLTNYLPFLQGELSFFTPLLTVVSILYIYPFYRKEEKKYFIGLFLLGILYDLFYTNLLFWNGILFLGIGVLAKFFYKNYGYSFLKVLIDTIIIIILYESASAIIIYIFQLVPMTLYKLIDKITHSLLLNIIYMEIWYLIIKFLPKKYKKISIN